MRKITIIGIITFLALLAVLRIPIQVAYPGAHEIRFEDYSRKADLPDIVIHSFGAAWGYENGDTYPDLYIPLHEESFNPVLLFLNKSGTAFEARSDLVTLNLKSSILDLHAPAWGNFFSKDPRSQDLYQQVGGRKGNEQLRHTIPVIFFSNSRGKLKIADESIHIRNMLMKGPLLRGQTVLPIDFNRDGHIDLLLTGAGNSPFRLLKNVGGNFTDASEETGMINVATKNGWKATTVDLNDDSFDDIILGSGIVYFNEKGKAFKKEMDLGKGGEFVHVAVADLNNDGHHDVFLLGRNTAKSVLLMKDATGKIYKRTPLESLHLDGKGVQVNIGDFDNDGNEDVMVVTLERVYLFQNIGGGKFRDVTESSGLKGIFNSGEKGEFRCVAFADYDLDGKLDVIGIKGQGGFGGGKHERGPVILSRNTSSTGHYLRLMLKGTKSNPQGLGAKVTVKTGEKQIVRRVTNGISATCQNDTALHIGLGQANTADIEIFWPSGNKTVIERVKADQYLVIIEDEPSPQAK